MIDSPDVRWKQRLQSFEKARKKLLKFHLLWQTEPANEAYQLSLIQSFEFTYELGWKVVKDYLKANGVFPMLPREVIKEGFSYGIIEDGQAWINMMEDRNLMSHSYDEKRVALAIERITLNYIQNINQVYLYLDNKQ